MSLQPGRSLNLGQRVDANSAPLEMAIVPAPVVGAAFLWATVVEHQRVVQVAKQD